MRITYYQLPQTLSAREQYRILKAEGYCDRPEPPQELSDEQILKDMGIYHQCSVRECKRMIKKYGGGGLTQWFDRDGSLVDSMEVRVAGRNRGSYGSI